MFAVLPCASGWADLREDEMINPAPGFGTIFGPPGPPGGPGAPGTAPLEADCTKNQTRRPIMSRSGHFVFLGRIWGMVTPPESSTICSHLFVKFGSALGCSQAPRAALASHEASLDHLWSSVAARDGQVVLGRSAYISSLLLRRVAHKMSRIRGHFVFLGPTAQI